MDYMYNACSTTARRGALDWAKEFEKVNLPVFERLYESVKNGTETRRSLEFNGRATYREDLAKELKEIDEQEIWRAGVFHSFFRRRYLYTQSHAQARLSALSGRTGNHKWLADSLSCRAYPKALAGCIIGSILFCEYLRIDVIQTDPYV